MLYEKSISQDALTAAGVKHLSGRKYMSQARVIYDDNTNNIYIKYVPTILFHIVSTLCFPIMIIVLGWKDAVMDYKTYNSANYCITESVGAHDTPIYKTLKENFQ